MIKKNRRIPSLKENPSATESYFSVITGSLDIENFFELGTVCRPFRVFG